MKKGISRVRGKPARHGNKPSAPVLTPTPQQQPRIALRGSLSDPSDDFDADEEIARLLAARQGYRFH